MIWRKVILTGVLFSAPLCFGIGRTGNGSSVGDLSAGYNIDVPAAYQPGLDQKIANDGLMVTNPFGFNFGPLSIQFRNFSVDFSELADSSREQISKFFVDRSWLATPTKNECVDLYMITNSTAVNAVAIWGSQNGVVILGTDPSLADQVTQMASAIVLEPGACQWK